MDDGTGKYFVVKLVKLTTLSSYSVAEGKQHFGLIHVIHTIMVS